MFVSQNKPVLRLKDVAIGMRVKRISEPARNRGRDYLNFGVIVSEAYRGKGGGYHYYVDVQCGETGKIYSVHIPRLTKNDD